MTSHGFSPTVHRVHDDALANTSYLIEVGDGQAAVIDPPRDVEAHFSLARRLGLEIVAVLDTHLHADYLSGSAELAPHGAETIVPLGPTARWSKRGLHGDDGLI